jgi:hypothetical protein
LQGAGRVKFVFGPCLLDYLFALLGLNVREALR